MDEPSAQHEAAQGPGAAGSLWDTIKKCWNTRDSLWIALIVLVLGVIGQILLYVVPSEEYVINSGHNEYQLIGSLRVVSEAAMYLGAVWAGVYLARWGIRRNKS